MPRLLQTRKLTVNAASGLNQPVARPRVRKLAQELRKWLCMRDSPDALQFSPPHPLEFSGELNPITNQPQLIPGWHTWFRGLIDMMRPITVVVS
jgi:hypothetical protein